MPLKKVRTCSFCSRRITTAVWGTYYCSLECETEGKKFYSGFKTTTDTLTAQIQLERVTNKAMDILKERYGQIIPRQTNEQLLAVLTEVLETK